LSQADLLAGAPRSQSAKKQFRQGSESPGQENRLPGLSITEDDVVRVPNSKLVKCARCAFELVVNRSDKLSTMESHVNREHKSSTPWQCGKCGNLYASKMNVRSHWLNVHKTDGPVDVKMRVQRQERAEGKSNLM
jgi:hypothetical protein